MQVQMREHFERCAAAILTARKGKRLIVVHNGDAVDGVHHNTLQIFTRDKLEQVDLHVELMVQFKKWIGWQRGDELYYTKGTETHTDDNENEIGRQLDAVQSPDGLYVYDDLKLEVNGDRLNWTHHGPTSGKGPNKGNSFRNWLRDRFYEAVNEGDLPPHVITTSHTHDPYWQIYIGRYQGCYFPVRGLICPSFQQKTRYANGKVPLQKNKIGLNFYTVAKNGMIGDPVELLME
jgi:hypothetical protein